MPLEVLYRAPQGDPRPTPILLVHGLWHGAWAWEGNFLDTFAANGYATYAVSLTGHGNSPGDVRWVRSPRLLRDLEEVAATLPTRPIVMGHSMGGYLVQKYLERNEAPLGVLIASVPHFGAIPASLRFARRHPLKFLKILYTLNVRPVIETPALAREHLYWSGTPDAIVNETFPKLQGDSFFLYLDIMLLNLPRPKKIKTPLLVVGGNKDGIFTPHEIEETARCYHAESIMFSNMGHNVMRDVGWQKAAERIVKWLREHGH